jgi:sugar lactone lactonase YvrE
MSVTTAPDEGSELVPRRTDGVFSEGYGFAEGLRWRDGHLYVSDIPAGTVHRIGPDGSSEVVVEVPGSPSGLGFLPNGDLLIVSMRQRSVLRFSGTSLHVHADLNGLVHSRLNDMVVSLTGHAYVTSFGYEELPRRATSVVHVRPDGSATMAAGELWRPNGAAITPDGRLVVAETRIHRLTEFTLSEDGSPVDPQVLGSLPSGSWADGITVDVEGAVWVADPKAMQCVRMDRDGRITDVVDTSPLPSITCTLGGANGTTLYIVVSEMGDPDELLPRKQARIEHVSVSVAGAGSP